MKELCERGLRRLYNDGDLQVTLLAGLGFAEMGSFLLVYVFMVLPNITH